MHPDHPHFRLTRWARWLEDAVLVLTLLSMLGLAVAQIILRNLFDSGIIWGDSLLRVLVLWVALLGAAIASRNGNHISIDIVSRLISANKRWLLSAATSCATLVICIALTWHSYRFVAMEFEDPIIAFANVPTWVCELILPIGFAVISLRYALLTGYSLYYRKPFPANTHADT